MPYADEKPAHESLKSCGKDFLRPKKAAKLAKFVSEMLYSLHQQQIFEILLNNF